MSTDVDSFKGRYYSLIRQCFELPERNEEMELSIFQSLFQDQRYDLILEGLKKGLKVTPEVHEMILESGDLKLYQYLHSQNELDLVKFPVKIFTSAIKSGNLGTVVWLFGYVPRKREDWLHSAILFGHLVIAKWLFSEGCPLPENAWSVALVYLGNQDMLDWLFEIKHPFQYWTCTNLASEGNLELLQWFRAKGCPWSRIECLMIAKRQGHHHIVEWIESQPD